MTSSPSYLMHTYNRQPVSFVRGSGAYLWDADGVEYLDGIAGVAVTSLGHADPEIATAIAEQAALIMHTTNMFGIEWQEKLGAGLCRLSGMERAFFCNSGAEANEAALKLARLHANSKQIAHPQVIVMENSFHGRTFATLAATGNPAVQRGFEPLMPGFLRVPYNDIDAIRDMASQYSNIVAVLVEPVQGEGGINPASAGYLQALRLMCDKNDWLMMIDEVQTGMGRTGTWFGFQHSKVIPDVITLAKALGNGFPIGACLARGKATELFSPGHHASTFGGNHLACRVGCAVVEIMERENIPQRAADSGARLLTALKMGLNDHPNVVSIRGVGMMIGIELDHTCTDLVGRARDEQRLLITVTRNTTVRLLPPLICNDAQIDEMAERVIRLLA